MKIKLKDIFIRQHGINITAKQMEQLDKGLGQVKVFAGGNTVAYVDYEDINNQYINKPSIIVKSRGNIDFEYYDKPFTHKNEMWSYSLKKNNMNILFVYYYLKYNVKYFINNAVSGKLPQISTPLTDNYNIPVPPREEQDKIANILSQCDRLIDLNQRLINEEKQKKKYLMSMLLNPNSGMRLPGFTEPWKKEKLGDICKIDSNGVDKKINPNEQKVRLLNFVDIYKNDYIYNNIPNMVVTASKNKIKDCSVCKGDVYITFTSEIRNELAFSGVIMEEIENCCYSYHIMRIRPNINNIYHSMFLSNSFNINYIHNEICKKGVGDIRCVVSKKNIENVVIYLPSLDEQKAIANILYTQDNKIELLEKELELWKLKKKGLMQLLLTGLVRVN